MGTFRTLRRHTAARLTRLAETVSPSTYLQDVGVFDADGKSIAQLDVVADAYGAGLTAVWCGGRRVNVDSASIRVTDGDGTEISVHSESVGG